MPVISWPHLKYLLNDGSSIYCIYIVCWCRLNSSNDPYLMVTRLENGYDGCCQKHMGLSPDLQYMLFRALMCQCQRGTWASRKFQFDQAGLKLLLLPPACKEPFMANLVALQYSAFWVFKAQILKFSCQLIWRALKAHPPCSIFYLLIAATLLCPLWLQNWQPA